MPAILDLNSLGKEKQENDKAFFINSDKVQESKIMSLADIEKFVVHHMHNYYCQGHHNNGFTSEELRRNVLLHIPVSVALNEWLNSIENKSTKECYSTAVRKLKKEETLRAYILNEHTAITSLDKNRAGTLGVYNLIESMGLSKCITNLMIAAYSSFCDFIKVKTLGVIDPEVPPKQKLDFYKVYDKVTWDNFFSKLPGPFDLIAEMTFYAAKNCHYTLRISDPRRNALSLKTSQIDFEHGAICFTAEQSRHVIGTVIRFPHSFMERLKRYIGDREGLVFVNPKKRSQLYGKQVERAFEKVSENLFSFKITPLMVSWAGEIASNNRRNAIS